MSLKEAIEEKEYINFGGEEQITVYDEDEDEKVGLSTLLSSFRELERWTGIRHLMHVLSGVFMQDHSRHSFLLTS